MVLDAVFQFTAAWVQAVFTAVNSPFGIILFVAYILSVFYLVLRFAKKEETVNFIPLGGLR